MPSLSEALRAIEGSVAIARRDPDASRFFDLSADAFWRSFAVVIFLVPLYFIVSAAETRMLFEMRDQITGTPPGYWDLLISNLTTLGIEWFAYPIAILFIAPLFSVGQRVSPYIIVYNWSSLMISLVMLPNFVLYLIGVFPIAMAVLVNFGLVLAVVWYRFLLAREVLGAPIGTAIGFVALDVVLSLFISSAIEYAIIGPL
ncbi:hypothetical protein NBRC116588_16880 [Pyruvatibacter sp. HU-CL02332]|uniref:hypothetical protein n=1 Tax=Pyruvatibacter sp. HU-CL02332 TaxID=3127650 RepID=UPI0031048E3D